MKRIFYRKVFKSGNSFAIRIPKEVATAVGLKEGMPVDWQLDEITGQITIVPVKEEK